MPEYDLHLNKRHAGDAACAACMAHMRKLPLQQSHLDYLTSNTTIIHDHAATSSTFPINATIICATNDLVDRFNLQQLNTHHGIEHVVELAADHEFRRCLGLTDANKKDALDRMNRRSDLAPTLPLAVGCPVTITRNILPSKKLYNGTRGTVVAVTTDSVLVAVPHLQDPVTIRKQQDTYFMPGGGLLVRKMFPLKCAYAQTVHNVQGDTIFGTLIIHLAGFAGRHGLAYVACSRATCAANVTFILPDSMSHLTLDMFTPHTPGTA